MAIAANFYMEKLELERDAIETAPPSHVYDRLLREYRHVNVCLMKFADGERNVAYK